MTDNDRHSSSQHLFLPIVVLILCLLAGGCVQTARSLVDLSQLQAAISREYSEKEVNVNLSNSTFLSITFINSPLNARSPEEREKRAAETAVFVTQHYPSSKQLSQIWVGFVKSESRFIIVHYSVSLDVFGFYNDGRPLPRREDVKQGSNSTGSIKPIAAYSPALKQTEVMIPRLQLEGDSSYGLALSPHFTVPGDATGVRRLPYAPPWVGFDFASYSEMSMFPGKSKIAFLSDGKVVSETTAQFASTKMPEGKFSEVLLLQIPYSTFLRMTAGKKLTFLLGDRQYDLTVEQLAALREMTQYVRE